jgi:hypothetical protein
MPNNRQNLTTKPPVRHLRRARVRGAAPYPWLKHVFTQPGSKPEKLYASICFPLCPQQRTPGHGCCVDDVATFAMSADVRKEGSDAVKHAHQVDVQHPPPSVERDSGSGNRLRKHEHFSPPIWPRNWTHEGPGSTRPDGQKRGLLRFALATRRLPAYAMLVKPAHQRPLLSGRTPQCLLIVQLDYPWQWRCCSAAPASIWLMPSRS